MRYFCVFLFVASAFAETTFVGNPARPGELQNDIVKAYLGGSRQITINPGIYTIAGPVGLTGLQDVEISAYEVELAVASRDTGAIIFENCRNLTFKGAVLRYTKPHTGQAKILAIGADGEGDYCDIQLEPGYPEDATFKITGVIDGATLTPKTDGGSARLLKPLGQPGRLRLYWTAAPSWKKFPEKKAWAAPGDFLVCRGPGGMMLYAKGSQYCTFEDITIYWGGQFGFYETHSASANRYVRATITYGPIPPGGNMRPLASQSADGLHSGGSIVGPTMENCFFEGQMDDGVNIHGSFYQIAKTRGTRITMGFPDDFLAAPREYAEGDTIGIYDLNTHAIVERKIIAIEESPFVSARQSQHERFRNFPMHFVELVLDGEVNVPYDSVAWFPGRCGAGYRISGCTVRNSWSRGFLLKANDGTLVDCVVENTPGAGVVLSTEMNWAEAGFSRRVKVQGNTLRGCGFLVVDALGGQAGGVVVTSTGMLGLGHEQIEIRDNTFENISVTNLVIRWARDVVVSGNRFVNPLQTPSLTGHVGKPFGIDSQAVVWISDSNKVTLSDNYIVNLGSFARSPLSLTPSAVNVEGTVLITPSPAE